LSCVGLSSHFLRRFVASPGWWCSASGVEGRRKPLVKGHSCRESAWSQTNHCRHWWLAAPQRSWNWNSSSCRSWPLLRFVLTYEPWSDLLNHPFKMKCRFPSPQWRFRSLLELRSFWLLVPTRTPRIWGRPLFASPRLCAYFVEVAFAYSLSSPVGCVPFALPADPERYHSTLTPPWATD